MVVLAVAIAGLIPAYAGSTVSSSAGEEAAGAHPRLRGEHQPGLNTTPAEEGSSPLTRGAPTQCPTLLVEDRLIPAYAGSTTEDHEAFSGAAAHPRLRGEHWARESPLPKRPGSSPLTRGAPLLSRNNMSLRAILHTASSGGLKAYLLEYANLPLSVGCTSCELGGLSTNPSDASSALVYVGASLT